MTSGVKYDEGKPPVFTQVIAQFPRAVSLVASVGDFGARKYSSDNWRRVDSAFDRYSNALLRHMLEEGQGKALDNDSGFLHVGHVAWNALARAELILEDLHKSSKEHKNYKQVQEYLKEYG